MLINSTSAIFEARPNSLRAQLIPVFEKSHKFQFLRDKQGIFRCRIINTCILRRFLMVNLPLEVQTILFAFTPLFSMLVKEPLPQL